MAVPYVIVDGLVSAVLDERCSPGTNINSNPPLVIMCVSDGFFRRSDINDRIHTFYVSRGLMPFLNFIMCVGRA